MRPELPLNIDLFVVLMFLGTVQGIFLSFFFLTKKNRKVKSNLFLGLLLLSCSIISIDILLSYSNLMFKFLWFVDATEPFNLLFGPLFYLYISAKLDESKTKKYYYHFIPAVLYFFYSFTFHFQSIEYKYNSYIDQYHPTFQYLSVPYVNFESLLFIKEYINISLMASIAVYLILSYYKIITTYKNESFAKNQKKLISILWFDATMMTVIVGAVFYVKIFIDQDLGDYIIILAFAVLAYSLLYKVIRDSLFFDSKLFEQKYSKSGLDEESSKLLFHKIEKQFIENKFHLSPNASIAKLSELVGSSTNYVSQVINQQMDLSFPELLAKYRIDAAKEMLANKENTETIETIAYSVGYNSKSTFHITFKKITGMTPAEYKARNKV